MKRKSVLPLASPQASQGNKQVAAMTAALKDIAEAQSILRMAQSPAFETQVRDTTIAVILAKIRRRADQSQISIYCSDHPGFVGEIDGQRYKHEELANKGMEIVEQLGELQTQLELMQTLVKAFFPNKKSKELMPTTDQLAEAIAKAEAASLTVPEVVKDTLFTRTVKEAFENGDFAMLAKLFSLSKPCEDAYVIQRGLCSMPRKAALAEHVQTKNIMSIFMEIFRTDKTKDRLASFLQELGHIDVKNSSLGEAIKALAVVVVLDADSQDAQQAISDAKTTLSNKEGTLHKALHVLPLGRAIMGDAAQILLKFEADQNFEGQLPPLLHEISEAAKVKLSSEADYTSYMVKSLPDPLQ